MAIQRQRIIDATNEEIRAEFSEVVAKLALIVDREDRLKTFLACLATLSDPAKQLVELFSQKEQQHIDHVRRTMQLVPEFAKDRPLHDFSKDKLYFFVTTSNFDCQVKNEFMEKLFKMEVNYHYSLEPHHEQYEAIHGNECSSDDIREMAIDRMSRSIQGNNGVVNVEEMQKYVPNFPLGDKEKKQCLFNQYLLMHKDITEKTYREMY